MLDRIRALWGYGEGPTLIQCALMLALVAVVAFLVATALGAGIPDALHSAHQQLSSVGGG